ncbi:hypothetical protein EDEG_02995 [Edhazardia aedis USNM 41457]|uniref:ADP,ATP carrier protein n=1 Tax=Edhazardia aedis (strain USNM 41457) TaxID=1003232 RepID=J8ZSH8_EDHAE|nr:hypothetical protein EDEG_02995 [Edhazardia aedis USNM 41457]|eukprot:EJW02598.1 hypothetical protein EDEG_02995 [Edhazardia aedis USNM 41457]
MRKLAVDSGKNIQTTVITTEAINQAIIAIAVIIILLTPCKSLVQNIGWTLASLITPIWALLSCLSILGLAGYNTSAEKCNAISYFNTFFGDRTMYIKAELYVGSIFVSGMKICKYAFFDIAKEALSMKIADDKRAQAKSIYDGVCGKLGKTGGSAISIIVSLLCNCDDLRRGSLVLFSFVIAICLLWFNSVRYLGSQYHQAVANKDNIDMDYFGAKKQKGKNVDNIDCA